MNDRDCKNCKHHTEKGCDSWDCNFERRMTREDAIKRLKLWLICSEEYTENDVSMNDAIRIAINSLEIDERYELEYENADEIHREKEQAYMQGYEDACKKYRQEPKTGHWKHNKCDKCGSSRPPLFDYYCPNCGAKMVESEVEK